MSMFIFMLDSVLSTDILLCQTVAQRVCLLNFAFW